MTSERYQQGLDKLKVLSPDGTMDIGEGFKDIAPDLQRSIVEFAFGDIYSRPGLTDQQKVMTTITALVAQGKPQIEMHIKTGLTVGVTPEEIVGCIIHCIPYTGFPSALNALKVAQKVFNERGIKVDTSELT